MGYSMDSSDSLVGYGCIFNCILTPTPVDDGLVKKVYKVLDWVAINVGKAKDK